MVPIGPVALLNAPCVTRPFTIPDFLAVDRCLTRTAVTATLVAAVVRLPAEVADARPGLLPASPVPRAVFRAVFQRAVLSVVVGEAVALPHITEAVVTAVVRAHVHAAVDLAEPGVAQALAGLDVAVAVDVVEALFVSRLAARAVALAARVSPPLWLTQAATVVADAVTVAVRLACAFGCWCRTEAAASSKWVEGGGR